MRPRRGFVLLLVLVMIALAALLTASVARRSLVLAVDGAKAQEDLQRRWGAISCRQAVLQRAEILFRKRELGQRPDRPLPPQMTTSILLGNVRFDLLLCDEQAKLNLNTVFAKREARGVEQTLFETSGSATYALVTELCPHPDAAPNLPYPPAFDSWGQVFSYQLSHDPSGEQSLPRGIAEATAAVTCWGDGRLSIRRADPTTLRMACELLVSAETARQVVETRAKNPDWNLENLLAGIDLRRKEQQDLSRWLTDRSTCHALWIIMGEGSRQWAQLDVSQSAGQGDRPQITTFYW